MDVSKMAVAMYLAISNSQSPNFFFIARQSYRKYPKDKTILLMTAAGKDWARKQIKSKWDWLPTFRVRASPIFSTQYFQLYKSGESHECHSKDTCSDKGNRDATEWLRHLVERYLLTQAGKEHHGKAESDR